MDTNSSFAAVPEQMKRVKQTARLFSVNVCVCETMPGTHAVHTAADPKVGTSREPRRWRNSSIWLLFYPVIIGYCLDHIITLEMNAYVKEWNGPLCCGLLVSDVIKWAPVDSCIYLGYEKFRSPRSAGRDFLDTAQQVQGRKKWMRRVNDSMPCSSSDRRRIFSG